MNKDFQEIGHCGGRLRVEVETSEDGGVAYSVGYSISSAGPAAFFMIYALPQGIPVATIPALGLGQEMPAPPYPGCFPLIIASDSEGRFGHRCERCGEYWRSSGAPSAWPLTCPYCGLRAPTHAFLTLGHRAYVSEFCELIESAIDAGKTATIDMDVLADKVGKDTEKPRFYYSEVSQQNQFTCGACGAWSDVLGRYAYCSSCGTRNDIAELEATINRIRKQMNGGGAPEVFVKDVVGAFDTTARKLVDELVRLVPMTTARQNRLKDKRFHNLRARANDLSELFGINVFDGFQQGDIDFAAMMFCRRHVYEHSGGEVDEKYIKESGDVSVRPKQTLRETKENAHRLAGLVTKMVRTLHNGFHDIFPAHPIPLKIEAERQSRTKTRRELQ
ncbi:MAG: hypothetical protein HQL35_15655 [Alphaproteobacteria bacterium]|nr:hypothetical protein [Alphaproteobacteria bacterium]